MIYKYEEIYPHVLIKTRTSTVVELMMYANYSLKKGDIVMIFPFLYKVYSVRLFTASELESQTTTKLILVKTNLLSEIELTGKQIQKYVKECNIQFKKEFDKLSDNADKLGETFRKLSNAISTLEPKVHKRHSRKEHIKYSSKFKK